MFDEGVLFQPDGRRVDLLSWERLRYAEMLVHLGWRHDLRIISDPERARAIVDEFADLERRVRSQADARAAAYVGAGGRDEVAEAILRIWHGKCRAAGMVGQSIPAR
jgi:hypothetical protein